MPSLWEAFGETAGELGVVLDSLELTRDEIVREMDRVSQVRLGTSAADVVRRYQEGALEDPGQVGDVLVLSDLLPVDDPIFG